MCNSLTNQSSPKECKQNRSKLHRFTQQARSSTNQTFPALSVSCHVLQRLQTPQCQQWTGECFFLWRDWRSSWLLWRQQWVFRSWLWWWEVLCRNRFPSKPKWCGGSSLMKWSSMEREPRKLLKREMVSYLIS